MDLELPELSAIANASLLDIDRSQVMLQDLTILKMGNQVQFPQPTRDHASGIAFEPASLRIAFLGSQQSQPSGRFFFNPNSETEASDQLKDFHDAQRFHKSPTFSDLNKQSHFA